MITYFEGVDGSGKSTLVDYLNRHYKYPIAKAPDRMDDKYAELTAWYEFDLVHSNSVNNWIVDRGPLTEFVYRFVRQDTPSYLQLRDLQDLLSGHKIVLCSTMYSWQRSMKRGEDNITDKTLHEQIKQFYVKAAQMVEQFANCKVFNYCTDGPGFNTELINFLERR